MLTIPNITLLDICLAGIGAYLVQQVLTKKNPAPYPPGPTGWPLVGNISDMPHVKPWLAFAEWGKKYGAISHIEVLGQHIIVLNSVKATMEMLNKKSSVYSDRPVSHMAGELVGWKHTLAYIMPYGDHLRWHRKNFHRIMGGRTAVKVYHPIEEIETRRFLKRVLAKPDELMTHVRHTAGAVIMRISHGYEVKESNDPFVDLADRALNIFSKTTVLSGWMVDAIPLLANVPEWFPGAGFKRLAREWSGTVEEMASAPFQFVKDQMAAGVALPSFTSDLLEGRTLSAEEEHLSKWSAATLYGGGADSTVSSIYAFFLAMTLFPDVQKKAQAEIDAVIGPDRLPSFADRDTLPYIEALVNEVFRWNAVFPTCIPHRVTEDDFHDGYYIPKGSLIIPNIWFMLNDPEVYPNPSEFNPERFLANDGKKPQTDPRTICFGFGRRICPGLHLADASVWMSVAMSLTVFNISKVVENGVEIIPELDPTTGSISHPKPFKCSIKPRSAKAVALIEEDANH